MLRHLSPRLAHIPLFVVSLLLLIRNLYLAQKLRDVREGHHHDDHPAASGAGPTRAAPDEAEQKV